MENINEQQGEDSWRSQGFRQNVRTKIEEAIRQSGNPTTKSVVEMENHVFQKAKTREEYLGFVARLILHVRDMNSKKMPPAPNQPGQVSDPMSALKSMAGQASAIPPQAGQAQMTASLLGSGAAICHMQPGGMGGQPPPQMGPVTSAMSPQQPGMNPMVMQQARFLGPGGVMGPQQMGQRPQMLAPNAQLLQKFRQQQVGGPPPNVTSTQIPMQGNYGDMFIPQQQPSPMSQQFQGHSPAPASMPNQGPNSNQSTVPSPASLHSQALSGQMTPSPAVYGQSPGAQIVPSPIPNYSVRTPGVPSPGSALNTPVGSNALQSPMNKTADELYAEKKKQLMKYVEPMKRMIEKLEKESRMGLSDRKTDWNRLKTLLDILQDSNKRCSLDVLLRCEQVLERLNLGKEYEVEQKYQVPLVQSFPQVKPQEQNIFQPLVDALTNLSKSPMFNHVLEKAFGPPIVALFGHSVNRNLPPRPRKRKIEEDPADISDILQGEIARLDQKFKVQLDPVQHMGSKTVHLICQLDDKNLPCVPSISITVPENYPEKPPQCFTTKDEYESTSILQNIQLVFSTRLATMPQKYSITCLLDTWEMSVRQACASKPQVIQKEVIVETA